MGETQGGFMSKADFIGGLGIAIVGLLLIFVIIPMGTEKGAYYGLSPTFFPTVVAAIMTLCAVGLAVQGWLHMRSSTEPRPIPVRRWNIVMFLLAASISIGGVVAIEFFGLVFVAPVLIAVFMLFLGERNLLLIGLTSTLPVALVYLLAANVLRAPLP
jgi:hypothetical protein